MCSKQWWTFIQVLVLLATKVSFPSPPLYLTNIYHLSSIISSILISSFSFSASSSLVHPATQIKVDSLRGQTTQSNNHLFYPLLLPSFSPPSLLQQINSPPRDQRSPQWSKEINGTNERHRVKEMDLVDSNNAWEKEKRKSTKVNGSQQRSTEVNRGQQR